MKILKKIYFSPLGYIISIVQNFFSIIHRPFMVYGFNNRVQKRLMRNTRVSSATKVIGRKKLNINDNVWIGHYCVLDASNGITIGRGVQTGSHISIYTHSSHVSIRLMGDTYISAEERIGYVKGGVSIGEFSFIGDSAVIFPGVKVGKGCLIKAGSVLTKEVPDFSIVQGVPAKVVGNVLDIDREYLSDPRVRETYFESSVINEKKIHE